MRTRELTSKIRSGFAAADPNMTCGQKFLLGFAGIFRFTRKIRILRKKENIVPYAFGSFLDVVTKKIPSLREAARIPFGTISILRCVEDLAELSRLIRLAGRLLIGKEYVIVKKDAFVVTSKGSSPSIHDKMRRFTVVYKEQIKLFFKTIVEIFKRFIKLILHLGDVYAAFTENAVPEVFIHSRDLWNKLTSSKSTLVKYLQRHEKINDWMLETMGSTKKTAILVKVLLAGAKVREKCRNVKERIIRFVREQYLYFQANAEFQMGQLHKLCGGDESQLRDRKFWIYTKGSKNDPRLNRFIKPPIMSGKWLKGKRSSI